MGFSRTTGIVVGALCCAAGAAHADLVEPFTYADGSLTTVSGGAWEKWSASGSGDGTIASQALRLEDSTDVIRFFGNVFGSGSQARISFDLNINKASTEEYEVFFGPSASPADANGNTNYNEGVLFRFGEDNVPGSANVTIYDGDDIPGGQTHTNIASVTTGATHSVVADLSLSGTTVTYSVKIDNATVLSSASFSLNDARGLNAVEPYTVGDGYDGSLVDPSSFATIDNLNIVAVPEPATLTIAGFAIAFSGMRIRRRRY